MHSTRFQRLHRRFGAALMPSRIAFLAVLLYLISLIPIFLFSSYCHPLADDFTYGLLVHRAVVSGGGIPEILSAAAETVRDYYFTWQGTFSAIFLFALQPGAFSESAYFLTPFIIIGCLSLSTFVLMHFVYCRLLGGKSSQAVILSALTLLLSVQMVTNQAQAFYWFNGASYYAVFYSFSLLFFAGIGTLLLDAGKKVHPVLTGCCALLAVLIGGGNYSTALTTSFIASVLCAAWLFFKKPGRFRLAVILLILLVSFAISVLAPGNAVRAAREASIYTGLTLAEYYRDMGYDVAIMADSTSRWAEALRELSGRLEEMPAEEGFPAYLASRLSAFYERAGMMQTLNGATGSVSIIGAVSPQGGDFSEPVTQNTKRFVRCFWGLDKSLAYARHFPAIHWLTSYSEYLNDLSGWYSDHVSPKFVDYRNRLMAILNQESSLMEIVKLIGGDVLPDDQKLILEIAKVIRLGFLQQNAFHKDDTCVSLEKQFKMMDVILYLYKTSRKLVAMGMPMSVLKAEGIFEKVIAIKYDVPNDNLQLLDLYKLDIDDFYNRVIEKNA